jgi:hypothetical protein
VTAVESASCLRISGGDYHLDYCNVVSLRNRALSSVRPIRPSRPTFVQTRDREGGG